MNCCAPRRRVAALLALAGALLVALPAAAQMARRFPQGALRGELSFTQPPVVLLNGQTAHLAPGARIRGQNNMTLVSGAAIGQTVIVNYTLDQVGQPLEVWILRPEEIAMKPWPRTVAEARAWRFDAAAQTWTRP